MAKYNKQTSSTKHTHKLYLNRSDIKHKRHEKVGVIAVRGMHTHTHTHTRTKTHYISANRVNNHGRFKTDMGVCI